MKGVVFVVLAALLIGAFAEEESKVVSLDADNFDAKTKEGLWLIKFFAPWCGHCKRLAPTWIELSTKAEKFNVGEVDCTAQKDICQRFGVRGYPTIKFIANGGAAEDVRVPRTVEAYMEYIDNYLKADNKAEEKKPEEKKPEEKKPEEKKPEEEKPKSAVLSLTKETFDAELAKKPLAVKFFAPWCGHCKRLAPTWEEFAKANKEAPFTVAEVDCTAQQELCEKYGIRGYPTVKFLKAGEDAVEFEGSRTIEAFQSWADGFFKKEHSEL